MLYLKTFALLKDKNIFLYPSLLVNAIVPLRLPSRETLPQSF